jgi:hypothetical protein
MPHPSRTLGAQPTPRTRTPEISELRREADLRTTSVEIVLAAMRRRLWRRGSVDLTLLGRQLQVAGRLRARAEEMDSSSMALTRKEA